MGVLTAEFLSNQRKALRLPLRCDVRVEASGVRHDGYTEDVGPCGCRLVSDLGLEPGMSIRLLLVAPGGFPPLEVEALVVWSSADSDSRCGLAYLDDDRPASHRWFDGLAEAHAELLLLDRVPDRVPLSARLYVAPARPAQLGDEETAVLRVACSQATVAELRERLGADWSRAQRALFALLTRGVLTLDSAEAGDPAGWQLQLGGPVARNQRLN